MAAGIASRITRLHLHSDRRSTACLFANRARKSSIYPGIFLLDHTRPPMQSRRYPTAFLLFGKAQDLFRDYNKRVTVRIGGPHLPHYRLERRPGSPQNQACYRCVTSTRLVAFVADSRNLCREPAFRKRPSSQTDLSLSSCLCTECADQIRWRSDTLSARKRLFGPVRCKGSSSVAL